MHRLEQLKSMDESTKQKIIEANIETLKEAKVQEEQSQKGPKQKLYEKAGLILIITGAIFLLLHSLLVTKVPVEPFTRDVLGLPIPVPPIWTSFIPYLGFFLNIIYEYFSLHGLAGLTVVITLFTIGGKFYQKANRR